MKFITPTMRVAFGLVSLSFSVSMTAYTLGLFPDREQAIVGGRAALAENVALHCTLLASRNDSRTMSMSLEGLVERNEDVESAAIRRSNGLVSHSIGPHANRWNLPPGDGSTRDQMRVPILSGESQWGVIELRFRDQTDGGWFGQHPLIRYLSFFLGTTSILFFIFLQRSFRHLDPSSIITPRVRRAFDTLTEGLLVLDQDERILLANRAFATMLGMDEEELIGLKASELPIEIDGPRLNRLPWERAMEDETPQLGELMTLRSKDGESHVMKVNAAPVVGDDGKQRGVLVSFGDVTQIETSRVELQKMLGSISASRDEIQKQNVELERLASHDSLTGCLNRRAFFTSADTQWSNAVRHDQPLACIMVDLDHFKSVNDTHGHQMGDTVLQKAAHVLRVGRRPVDLICRYGGEEFCILLPQTDLDGAAIVADKIRIAIEACDVDDLSITASLGISARSMGAGDIQEMIDEADKCLYVSKSEGRNCVVRFDQAAERIANLNQLGSEATERADDVSEKEPALPFRAVTALVSALAYRDPFTADHSRRVADLSAATSRGLMLASDSFILETAALLHDIGKIGVPDAILLKPDALTDEEWQVMKSHERIGVEIVQSTFSNHKLAEIIRTYRSWFSGSEDHPELPSGDEIPLAARILSIADAFDSMTTRTNYREPLDNQQACTELRRCAGQQFDPELVERFITEVSVQDASKSKSGFDACKSVALSFGTQVERLAESLERQDVDGIAVLAQRLNLTALQYGESKIAEVASRLNESVSGESDISTLMVLTTELLELCSSTQRAQLNEDAAEIPAESGQGVVSSVTTEEAEPLLENFFSPDSPAAPTAS